MRPTPPGCLRSATFYPEPGAEDYVAARLAAGAELFKDHVQKGAFDVRDPLHPTEVAYFNPGVVSGKLDQAWAHVRYQPSTGLIWFTTQTGGFWLFEF